MKECLHCKDWTPNLEIISGWMSIAFVHGMMGNKKIKAFDFCPYCSAKLYESENDNE